MRDQLRDKAYYDKWTDFTETEVIDKTLRRFNSLNDESKARNASCFIDDMHNVISMRYSRGDSIASMRDSVQQAYELLQLWRKTLNSVQIDTGIRDMWENLTLGCLYHYLSLVAFMVSLRFPVEDILNVLKLVNHEGEDALLELIAMHLGKDSKSVQDSKYPKIYGDLVALTRANADEQPKLLKKYVERWRKLVRSAGWPDTHKGAEGAYVGYWCFEVALVVMLLRVDDSLVAEHPHYPADLVRHYRQQT
jgi:hypothetical protein